MDTSTVVNHPNREENPLAGFYDRIKEAFPDAHIVACKGRPGKPKAATYNWRKNPATRDMFLTPDTKFLSIIPGSIGLIAYDIDVNPEIPVPEKQALCTFGLDIVVNAVGTPAAAFVPSGGGGAHAFYRGDLKKYTGGDWFQGEAIYQNGYVVVYGEEGLNALLKATKNSTILKDSDVAKVPQRPEKYVPKQTTLAEAKKFLEFRVASKKKRKQAATDGSTPAGRYSLVQRFKRKVLEAAEGSRHTVFRNGTWQLAMSGCLGSKELIQELLDLNLPEDDTEEHRKDRVAALEGALNAAKQLNKKQYVVKEFVTLAGFNRTGFFQGLEAINAEIQRDVRSGSVITRGFDTRKSKKSTYDWRVDSDVAGDSTRLRLDIEEQCLVPAPTATNPDKLVPALWSLEKWTDRLSADIESVDLFAIWLKTLKPWDGVKRLDTWIDQCWYTDEEMPDELLAFASRAPFIAAVKRAFQPVEGGGGVPYDHVVLLIGDQNTGKSKVFGMFFPEGMSSEWYGKVRFGEEKDMVEACFGKVFVEMAELAGLGGYGADMDSLKSFITCQVDNSVRLAYRRNPMKAARRFVFIGTYNPQNNNEAIPFDATGHRRWIAVPVVRRDPPQAFEYAVENREQLWAEAIARQDESVEMGNELQELRDEWNEKHVMGISSAEDVFDSFLGNEELTYQDVERDGIKERDFKKFQKQINNKQDFRKILGAKLGFTRSSKRRSYGHLWTAPKGFAARMVEEEAEDQGTGRKEPQREMPFDNPTEDM